jgi:DNA-binding MarR family transcriptional regulator
MYALMETAFAIRARLEDALQSVGLSGAKYELLSQLAERGESTPLSQLALGQKCAASNITQLVDRLEAEGLVRRVDDSADRRSKRATLTPLGQERHAAGAIQVERIQAEFAMSLSEADREALARGLSAWNSK